MDCLAVERYRARIVRATLGSPKFPFFKPDTVLLRFGSQKLPVADYLD
jgi:hypothetical protein